MDSYPNGNKALIESLGLLKHPEGGYFVETDRQTSTVPSPFANNEERSLATSIYYLLSSDQPEGVIHMNKSVTYHVLHQGRAEYTLITPGVNGAPPTVTTAIMGTNTSAGETRLLLVGTGVWKMSRLLPADLALASTSTDAADHVGCLITEVVVPGFHWEDHKFLTLAGLEDLFKGVPGGEAQIEKLRGNVKKEA